MKKNLSREIMGAVSEMGKERAIVLWFARRRMYRLMKSATSAVLI